MKGEKRGSSEREKREFYSTSKESKDTEEVEKRPNKKTERN